MEIQSLAEDFVALCKAGKFEEAGLRYWSPDIVSVEASAPPGGDPQSHGLDAVKAKGAWWYANHVIHSVDVTGPYVNGDQFIVRFAMDVTFKPNDMRMKLDEDGLYTVRDGKIVEERFFYTM